jgi:hypothetical protein
MAEKDRLIVVVIMRNCLITANDLRLFRLLNQREEYRLEVQHAWDFAEIINSINVTAYYGNLRLVVS